VAASEFVALLALAEVPDRSLSSASKSLATAETVEPEGLVVALARSLSKVVMSLLTVELAVEAPVLLFNVGAGGGGGGGTLAAVEAVDELDALLSRLPLRALMMFLTSALREPPIDGADELVAVEVASVAAGRGAPPPWGWPPP